MTETALTTALNVSYMAEQIALFGLIVGIALLLSGIGFIILALIVLGAGADEGRSKAPAIQEQGATGYARLSHPAGRLEGESNRRSTSRSTKGRRKPPLQRSRRRRRRSRAQSAGVAAATTRERPTRSSGAAVNGGSSNRSIA